MTIVDDTLAELIAAIPRVMAAPTGDLGFGSDLSCRDDLTQNMVEVPGDSIQAVAEANYRRITTPRGSLLDDPDYGIDVREFLHQPATTQRQSEIAAIIRAELLKDDRNDEISVSLQSTNAGRDWTIYIDGQTAEGPFSLTIALTDGAALLKDITANATVA